MINSITIQFPEDDVSVIFANSCRNLVLTCHQGIQLKGKRISVTWQSINFLQEEMRLLDQTKGYILSSLFS
jgi:hypothetical protein